MCNPVWQENAATAETKVFPGVSGRDREGTRIPEDLNSVFHVFTESIFRLFIFNYLQPDGEDLKGKLPRAYSLRLTDICLRPMEGADIYQIAMNYRESVEMIEKYHASRLKARPGAAAFDIVCKKMTARKIAKEVRTGT